MKLFPYISIKLTITKKRAIKDIKIGEILEENMIEYKNPGTGIPPKMANLVIGKKAKENLYDKSL